MLEELTNVFKPKQKTFRGFLFWFFCYNKGMKKLRNMPGFTVLEFLIVLAIIIILVAIALPALERARTRSYNEKLVTDLKIVALGLEQFKQSCGEYPEEITNDYPCNQDDSDSVTLREFIPLINDYSFNSSDTSSEKPNISYYPFGNSDFCYGFHVGVTLRDAEDDFYVDDANFNSLAGNYSDCLSSIGSRGFNGSDPNLYDIVKQ